MTGPRLSQVDELILSEVARLGVVRSVFALAVEHVLNYEHARHRVARLEAAGLLLAQRQTNARGRPIMLSRPAVGKNNKTLGCPLQPCDGAATGRGR